MRINVLGLGESLSELPISTDIRIGVNDIDARIKCDYVVCVDRPNLFNKERFTSIVNSECFKFYSQTDEWKPYFSNFEKIQFSKGARGNLNDIDNTFPFSNNSTFVAVVLAYKLGATEISIFGADFNTHPNFKDAGLEIVLKDFKRLFDFLKSKGIKINVTKQSKINEII